jgi:hypothetical protein
MSFNRSKEAELVSASHLENLDEVKLEQGEALTAQERKKRTAMNSRILRKVCTNPLVFLLPIMILILLV